MSATASSFTLHADDRVVMSIDGSDINVDEFAYLYRKSVTNAEVIPAVNEFAMQFALFKMKIMEAEKLGLDTLASFRSELAAYSSVVSEEGADGNLMREYREGMLLYEITSLRVWNSSLVNDENLNLHFNENRERFRWESPRAKGWLLYADSEAVLAEACACIDSVSGSDDKVRGILTSRFGSNIHAVKFLVKEGISNIVDAEVFGHDVEYAGHPSWKNVMVYGGKILSQPEEWTDVKGELTDDYHAKLQAGWEKELLDTHTLEINYDVINEVFGS